MSHHCMNTTDNSRRRSGLSGLIIFGIFFAIFGLGIFNGSIFFAGFPIPTIFVILFIFGIVRMARVSSYRNRRRYAQQPPVYSTPAQPSADYQSSFSSQPKPQKETSSYCPACGTALGMVLEKNQSIYCSHCGEHISK